MGRHVICFLCMCVTVLLVICNPVIASDMPGIKDPSFLSGSLSDDLVFQNISYDAPYQVSETIQTLQEALQSGMMQTGPAVSLETGWQDVTMPAVISHPGQYRIINDYVSSDKEIGLWINCSDVFVDGNGHSFNGSAGYETVGLVASRKDPFSIGAGSDDTISNVTVTNFFASDCMAGIVFYGVKGGEISDTHHTRDVSGIILAGSKSLDVRNNTVAGSRVDTQTGEQTGIIGMQLTDVLLESNGISDIVPDEETISGGIYLIESDRPKVIGNSISGLVSRAVILMDCVSPVITRNEMTGPAGYGIFITESTGSAVTENIISGSVEHAVSLMECTESELIENRITGPGTHGIAIMDCTNSTVTGNEIGGSKTFGILTGPNGGSGDEYLNILDNRISSAGSCGIVVNDGPGILCNNTVAAGMNGIGLIMDDFVIANNTVRDNSGQGLYLFAKNLTLQQNILTNNTCNFFIEGFETEYFLHHIDRTNLINGKPLVYIRDSNGESIGPADNPAMVLVVNSTNIAVRNIATGANIAGVYLVDTMNATISGVNDTGSVVGFIALRSYGCMIKDSSSTKSSACGFYLVQDDEVSVDHCSVRDTSGNGYYLGDSDNVILNSGIITDFSPVYLEEDAYGMLIDVCRSIRIQNYLISDSPYSGIYAMNSEDIVVTDSHVADNNMYGISAMQSSPVYVNKSQITGNKWSGISLDMLSGFSLNQNIISGNLKSGLVLLDAYDGRVADNLFNNEQNVQFVYGSPPVKWNTTLTSGRNIVNGPYLGGNFWAAPDGTGFSQTHADRGDGICNASYFIADENIDYLPLAVPSEEIMVDFMADTYFGTPPLTVRFTDTSTGSPVSWNWNFGDGTHSSEQNPEHTYQGIGRYSVTLGVTGKYGNTEAIRRPVYIDVNAGKGTDTLGSLMVTSTPQNSSVYLDGKFKGLTPMMAFDLYPEEYRILVTHEGYRNWSGTGEVISNQCTYVPEVVLIQE